MSRAGIFAVIACTIIGSLHAQVAPPAAPAAPAAAAPAPDPNALKWSAESLEFNGKPGDETAPFQFYATNVSKTAVVINGLRTSCGCTVAQLPTTPYTLQPGSNVLIGASMDLRGKQGSITKTVTADTSVGIKTLLVKANVASQPAAAAPAHGAAPVMGDRSKNIQTALADRQAVFKGDCAKCHVDEGKGKFGKELYVASCGICHDAEHRAAMVPDLNQAKGPRDIAYWQKWIMEGKPGTMMPAFATAYGGPLTQEQIDSLTVYLFQNYPKGPQAAAAAAAPVVVKPAPAKAN